MAETSRLQQVRLWESNTLQSACDEKGNKKASEHNYNVPVRHCLAHRHLSLTLRGSNRIGSLSKNVLERRSSTRSARASIPVDMLLVKLLIRGRKLLAILSWCPAPCFPSLWQQHPGTSQALFQYIFLPGCVVLGPSSVSSPPVSLRKLTLRSDSRSLVSDLASSSIHCDAPACLTLSLWSKLKHWRHTRRSFLKTN